MKRKNLIKIIMLIIIILLLLLIYNQFNKLIYVSKTIEAYKNYNDYPVYDGRNVYEYWKETLNEEQQILYEEIKESYLQFKNDFSTQLNEISTKEFQEVYSTVLLDHAEIFWLDSYDNVQVDSLMN